MTKANTPIVQLMTKPHSLRIMNDKLNWLHFQCESVSSPAVVVIVLSLSIYSYLSTDQAEKICFLMNL